MNNETPLVIDCNGSQMMGILHKGTNTADVLVVMVVGGPQYRVGSHRMYLTIARELATSGISVLRFDCRGMGDSDGNFDSFEDLDDDIRCAVTVGMSVVPATRVVLFGLCDAASAIAVYGHRDPRVTGLILVNPWVKSEAGEARARVRHYYLKRLRQAAFWSGLIRDCGRIIHSLRSFGSDARRAVRQPTTVGHVDRMLHGLREFKGNVQILLSLVDLTAQEFQGLIDSSPDWRRMLKVRAVSIVRLGDADHTMSNIGSIEFAAAQISAFLASTVRRREGARVAIV